MIYQKVNGRLRYFALSVEPDLGQERFYDRHPMELLKHGEIADVPIIFGMARDEGQQMTTGILDCNYIAIEQITLTA